MKYFIFSLLICVGLTSQAVTNDVTTWPTTGWAQLYGQDSLYSDALADTGNKGHEYLNFVGDTNTYAAAYMNYRTAADSGESEDQFLIRVRVDKKKQKMSGAYQIFFETSYDSSVDWVLQLSTGDLDVGGTLEFGAVTGTNRNGVTFGAVVWSNDFTTTSGYAYWTGTNTIDGSFFNGDDDYFLELGLPWGVFTNYTGVTSTNDSFRFLITSSQTSGQIEDGDVGNSAANPNQDVVFDDIYADSNPDNGPYTQTITFANPGPQSASDSVVLDATATSGLAVSYELIGPASLSGASNLVFSGGGTVTVIAIQTGNSNWLPAPPITNSFTVTASNSAPVSNNDSYTVIEDTVLNVPVSGVLTNDIDVDGDSLSAIWFSDPSNGALALNVDGSFTYMPTNDFAGVDSFTYGATDGLLTGNVATVTLTVTNVNDAPVVGDDEVPVDEDGTIAIPVLDNDMDADGNPLIITGVWPTNGVEIIGGTNLVYTPPANFNGTNTFEYVVDDGQGGSVTGTVTVIVNAVNDVPVADADSYNAVEDTLLSIMAPGVLDGDTDADGDVPTAVLGSTTTSGVLTLNSDGSFTYMPGPDYNGGDSFTYAPSDGVSTGATVTVSLSVSAVNDAPVLTGESGSTAEDTPVTIDVLANDSDPDLDVLTLVRATASNGTAVVSGSNVTFTPSTNFNGGASVTYDVTDGTVTNSALINLTVSAVNDVPVAQADSYGVAEDGTLNVAAPGVLGNDSDVDGDSLSAILFADVTNGTLTLNLDGSFTYTPAPNYTGTDGFSYAASDGSSTGAAVSVVFAVNGANDAPTVVGDEFPATEDIPLGLPVLDNDFDSEGDPMTIVGVTSTNVTIIGGTNLVFTPPADYYGTNVFEYIVEDDGFLRSTGTVTVIVAPVNDVPVSSDDSYTVTEDTVLNVPVSGVLTNDTDVDGDPLSAIWFSDPTNGALALNVDGSFIYTPTNDFAGVDTFTYGATDGLLTGNVATVSLNVTNINDAPVVGDDEVPVNEDGGSITIPVLDNDRDADGNPLTITGVWPTNGVEIIGGTNLVYTPPADFNGTNTFSYIVDDGEGGSVTGTVTVIVNAVNDAPALVGENASVSEDTPVTVDVLANDSDVDGDALMLVSTVASNGTATVSGDEIIFTPGADFNGTGLVTYYVTDGTVTNSAQLVVTVTAVNDAPVLTGESGSTAEDTPITIDVLANDSDPDLDVLTLVSATASNGTAVVSGSNVTFTPSTNFNGGASVTYYVTDGTVTNSALINLTVSAVNDVPVAQADSYGVAEDGTLNTAAPGVLGNDSDVDGDSLSAILFADVTNGTLTLNLDGSFVYTPTPNYTGTDGFSYAATDGSSTGAAVSVVFAVNGANDAPTVVGDEFPATEDIPLGLPVLDNDFDSEGDPMTIVGVTSTNVTIIGGTNLVFTPPADYYGTNVFEYIVEDDGFLRSTGTVTVIVAPVNDAPVSVDDSYTVTEDIALIIPAAGVLTNDTDVDGDPLSAIWFSDPTNGALSFNTDGSFTYMPTNDFAGVDSFTYGATDGLLTGNVATVTLTVTNVNDASVVGDDEVPVNEDGGSITIPVLDNDMDADGNPLTITGVWPTNGVEIIGGTNLVYTPPSDFNGTNTFEYVVDDGQGGSVTGTVTVIVASVNDVPVADTDAYATSEDTPLNVNAAAGVLDGDTDVDGDSLDAVWVSDPSNGILTLNDDGSFSYTPNPNFEGSDSFEYAPTDGTVTGATVTVSLTVNAQNDVPAATDDGYSVDEDGSLSISAPGVLGNDTDVEGDALSAILFADVTNGTLSVSINGGFTYTPNADYEGTDSFTYVAADNSSTSSVATVTITVNGQADAPTVVGDDATTDEDVPVTIPALGNDRDVDGDPISIVDVISTNVTIIGGTNLVYTPPMDYNGTNTFEYIVEDTGGLRSTGTVSVIVNPINDAPAAVADSAATFEGTAVTVPVLENDYDVDSPNLTLLSASSSNGFAVVSGTNVVFTPAPGFIGSARVNYIIGDESLSSTGQVLVAVSAAADLSMTLIGPTNALVGMPLEYTVRVDNAGPSTASNIVVVGHVPADLLFAAASHGGSLVGSTVRWPLMGALESGVSSNFTFTVEAPLPGYFTNAVEIGSTTFDPDLSNNNASSAKSRVYTAVYAASFSMHEGPIVLSTQTGLFEQRVTVTNTTPVAVPGFRIFVEDLPEDVELRNASGSTNGVPFATIHAALDSGAYTTVVLEYFTPTRQPFTNTLRVEWILEEDKPVDAAAGFKITKSFMDMRNPDNHRFVIEFTTEPGAVYTIVYSDDLATWYEAPAKITAGGTRVQWYDDGPPKTHSRPEGGRYYKVVREGAAE